ncbi:MAG: periplasmic heavy metal sensor [Pseudomonadota bacterium]
MTSEPDTPKPRRWLMPALLASLTINLLVAGLVAGALLSPNGPRHGGGNDQRALRGVLGEPFFRALPQEQRRAMVRDIIGNREKFREGHEILRARVDSFLAALRSETFDRDEAERLLVDQRNAVEQRQDMGERLLLDRLEAMSLAERSAYADALEEQLKGRKRR